MNSKLFQQYLKKNILLITGEVNCELESAVKIGLAELAIFDTPPPIKVIFDTAGGRTYYGLHIYDYLKFYPGKKTGIVICKAFSMGAVILQACDERYALPHARILVHHLYQGSISLDTMRNPQKVRDLLAEMENEQERIYKLLIEATGKPMEEIRILCEKDEYLYPVEAGNVGLIDGIWNKTVFE